MRTCLILSVAAAVLAVLAVAPPARAQNNGQRPGVPDISGVWQVTKYQPKLFPNGGAPLTPWGEAKFKAANPETNDPNLACLPTGVPRLMFVPLPMEIFQVPTRVVIVHEGIDPIRQIYLNRQHPKDLDPTFFRRLHRQVGRRNACGGRHWVQRKDLA